MKVDIVSHSDGDWVGIYVDDQLKYEGHSLYYRDVLDAVGVKINSDTECSFEAGSLPSKLGGPWEFGS